MFRKEEQGGGGETGEVDVDPESLNSNTERILYNINENLKNGIAIKNAEDEDLTVKVGDTVTVDVQDSNLATRGDIESAESNIIAAMPSIPEFHCNYTPPSESK
jgi:transcription elongation GreA/GreB family factor